MIVGTAGHIDHGKTALVQALTGTDADRLAEEKARGITIDLGFAYADLGGGRVTGFVDVPGHERLIHTMLAGAGGIDFVLLVVAADDGVMPQTREHLAILDLLGITRGIVALTKADLAGPERRAEVTGQIRAALAATGLRDAPVVAVSSLTGEGIAELRAALIAAEAATAPPEAAGPLRFAVDRSFTLSGTGTVVTGMVLAGRVAVDDIVTVSPSGLPARVRGLHAQNRKAREGRAGQRCALNLAGDGVTKEAIHRGDMVVTPALHAPTDRIDAELTVLGSEPKPVGNWFPARLHSHAIEAGARIVPLQGPLPPGGRGFVQLVLDRPIAAAVGNLISPGDRVNLLLSVPNASALGLPDSGGPAIVHVFQDLEIIAIGTAVRPPEGADAPVTNPGASTYTVAVAPRDAARLLHLTRQYEVLLALVGPGVEPSEQLPVGSLDALPESLSPVADPTDLDDDEPADTEPADTEAADDEATSTTEAAP